MKLFLDFEIDDEGGEILREREIFEENFYSIGRCITYRRDSYSDRCSERYK